MSAQIDDWIAKVRGRGHDVWVSGPSTPDVVSKLEEFIGRPLPPSYASFLRSHGALAIYDAVVSGVGPGGSLRDGRGTVIHDTESRRSEGALPPGFIVIGPHEDGAYCLDLNRGRPDGECPVVNYEWPSVQHEKPLARTFEEWLVEFFLKPWSDEDA